ncbi:MAG: hypothetical protein AB7O59_08875 [Pirellulales bacterium]
MLQRRRRNGLAARLHRIGSHGGAAFVVAVCLAAGGLLANSAPGFADETAEDCGGGSPANVVAALGKLPGSSSPLTFQLGDFKLPRGGHLQGVQMRFNVDRQRHLAFLSHDSETIGYLLVVEFPADLSRPGRAIHMLEFPSDRHQPPLRHAGGIQLCGDVLAVGLEDNQQKSRSEVQFWNLADPTRPARLDNLTIRRSGDAKDQTAGAVALAHRGHDYLTAVANWDSRAIDFYTTNGKPLADPQCFFIHRTRFRVDHADTGGWQPDKDVAAYQAVNLVVDQAENVFLAGFATAPNGNDLVDLFAVDFAHPPDKLLSKVARKAVRLAGGAHFQNGAGLWNDRGRLSLLATPRNLSAETRLRIVGE